MSHVLAMHTVSDIFDVLGGNAAVGRILGVNPSTASEMKRRESIPVEYWPALVAEADRMGRTEVTLESMALVMADAALRRRSFREQETAA
jgi:hypothetical protein